MAPAVVNRLPIISNLLKWFKGDDLVIDNALFKLHHQVNKTLTRYWYCITTPMLLLLLQILFLILS